MEYLQLLPLPEIGSAIISAVSSLDERLSQPKTSRVPKFCYESVYWLIWHFLVRIVKWFTNTANDFNAMYVRGWIHILLLNIPCSHMGLDPLVILFLNYFEIFCCCCWIALEWHAVLCSRGILYIILQLAQIPRWRKYSGVKIIAWVRSCPELRVALRMITNMTVTFC